MAQLFLTNPALASARSESLESAAHEDSAARSVEVPPPWAVRELSADAYLLHEVHDEDGGRSRIEVQLLDAPKPETQPKPRRGGERGSAKGGTPRSRGTGRGRKRGTRESINGALLLRSGGEDATEESAWVWLAASSTQGRLWINGLPSLSGLRALRHGDEIRLGASRARVFFSDEQPSAVRPFDGIDGSICPRCRTELLIGVPAVRCQICGVFHHEYSNGPEPKPCWTYAPQCAACSTARGEEGRLAWVPDEGLADD